MKQLSRGRRIGQFVSGLGAAVLVFGAVPAVLIWFVRTPLPTRWDRAALLSPHGLFDLLAIVAWVAWAACSWQLIKSVGGRVRRGDVGLGRGATFSDQLAARIAGAVLIVATLGATASTWAGAATSGTARAHSQVAASVAVTNASPSIPSSVRAGAQSRLPSVEQPSDENTVTPPTVELSATTLRYTVVPGDSLWSIAEHLFGDGSEWEAIARLNLGHVMEDGRRFLDPSVIDPGWILSIPDGATGVSAGVTTTSPDGAPSPSPAAAGGAGGLAPRPTIANTTRTTNPPSNRPKNPSPSTTPVPMALAPFTTGHLARNDDQSSATELVAHRSHQGALHQSGHGLGSSSTSGARVPFPELASLGIGVLLAAALARRVRRARAQRGPMDAPPDGAVDAATNVAHFDGAPILDWFEVANRHLTAALRTSGRIDDAPRIRLFRVGADGVDAILAEKTDWTPRGWALSDEGMTWHLTSASDPEALRQIAKGSPPWSPISLPIGNDENSSWIVPLTPGSCLPILGRRAQMFVNAMKAAQSSWSWTERVVVTEDPRQAEDESKLGANDTGSMERTHVLFLGEPSRLSASALMSCATVTMLGVLPSDLSIVVETDIATVLPLGLSIQPNLLDQDSFDALQQLVDPDPPSSDPGPHFPPTKNGVAPPNGRRPLTDALAPSFALRTPPLAHYASAHEPPPGRSAGVRQLGAGLIEVKLLTSMPRIDGLHEPIDPKRARRSVELIAYLTIHRPDLVTSDRLRTRVLGTADADAAAKTLFNTATAARRAMGVNGNGDPFLPPGSKSGYYTVSPEVTVDANRAWTLVQAARNAADTDESIALYRAALELIEGEPFSGVLSGYAWWQAEGHEARVTGVLVDAACALAPLAMAGGMVDLARWALSQARLVDHYSEALSRAAMQVAAAAGDIDLLRREWAECQQRVNELDPGSLPSERTEQLFAQLSARETVSTGHGGGG